MAKKTTNLVALIRFQKRTFDPAAKPGDVVEAGESFAAPDDQAERLTKLAYARAEDVPDPAPKAE